MPGQVPDQVTERLGLPVVRVEPYLVISEKRTSSLVEEQPIAIGSGRRNPGPPAAALPPLPVLQSGCHRWNGRPARDSRRRGGHRWHGRDLRGEHRYVRRPACGDEEQDRPGDHEQATRQAWTSATVQVLLDLPDMGQGQQPPDIRSRPRRVRLRPGGAGARSPGVARGPSPPRACRARSTATSWCRAGRPRSWLPGRGTARDLPR